MLKRAVEVAIYLCFFQVSVLHAIFSMWFPLDWRNQMPIVWSFWQSSMRICKRLFSNHFNSLSCPCLPLASCTVRKKWLTDFFPKRSHAPLKYVPTLFNASLEGTGICKHALILSAPFFYNLPFISQSKDLSQIALRAGQSKYIWDTPVPKNNHGWTWNRIESESSLVLYKSSLISHGPKHLPALLKAVEINSVPKETKLHFKMQVKARLPVNNILWVYFLLHLYV